MRVGKWDEQKILFKNRGRGGHDHAGGTRGAHITSLAWATAAITPKALGTGCIQYVSSAQVYGTGVKARKLFIGTLTKYSIGTTCSINFGGATGWTSIDYSRVTSRSGFGSFAGGQEGSVEINNFNTAGTLYLFLSNGTIAPGAINDVHAFVIGT